MLDHDVPAESIAPRRGKPKRLIHALPGPLRNPRLRAKLQTAPVGVESGNLDLGATEVDAYA